MQDKSAIIDVLEGHLEEVVQGRVQAASENRRLHAEEGSLPLEAAVSTALQVLSEGGSTESAAQRAAAAEAAAQSSLETGLREELDEFGRDLNVQKRKDLQKRLAQRARRRQV